MSGAGVYAPTVQAPVQVLTHCSSAGAGVLTHCSSTGATAAVNTLFKHSNTHDPLGFSRKGRLISAFVMRDIGLRVGIHQYRYAIQALRAGRRSGGSGLREW